MGLANRDATPEKPNGKRIVLIENGELVGTVAIEKKQQAIHWRDETEVQEQTERYKQRHIHLLHKDETERIREIWMVPDWS